MSSMINADKALIFRIVHRENVPWILEHGMYCRTSSIQDVTYRAIGDPELIEKRQRRAIPIPPGGTLSDYIPFYFTPRTPMLYKIKTGHSGTVKVSNEDVVIFVSSLHRLAEMRRLFVFTDRHAYLFNAEFYNTVADLDQIDWRILQSGNFTRDPDDPEPFERYQAEALVYKHLPLQALIGIVCYTDGVRAEVSQSVGSRELGVKVAKKPEWYF